MNLKEVLDGYDKAVEALGNVSNIKDVYVEDQELEMELGKMVQNLYILLF